MVHAIHVDQEAGTLVGFSTPSYVILNFPFQVVAEVDTRVLVAGAVALPNILLWT